MHYTTHHAFIHYLLSSSHIVSIGTKDSWAIIQCPLSNSLCHWVLLPLHRRSEATIKSDSVEDSRLYTSFRNDITANADWWGCETTAEEFRRWWCDETQETEEESGCLSEPTHRNILRFYTSIPIYLSISLYIYPHLIYVSIQLSFFLSFCLTADNIYMSIIHPSFLSINSYTNWPSTFSLSLFLFFSFFLSFLRFLQLGSIQSSGQAMYEAIDRKEY